MTALFPCLLAIAPSAQGAATTATVLIDADDDAATGCAHGTLTGFEHALVTTFVSDTSLVTSVTRRACAGSAFGPAVPVGGPWNLAAVEGALAAEASVPYAALPLARTTRTRLAFVFDDGVEQTVIDELPGGAPIHYPQKHQARRRAVHPADGTQNIVADGALEDWARLSALLDRGRHVIWVHGAPNDFAFRFDVRAESHRPVARDDSYAVRQGQTLAVRTPGVLANDHDPEGSDLNAALVTPPRGALDLDPDGSFVYRSDGTLAPDGFEYKASDGGSDSNAARVTIDVTPNTLPIAGDDAYTTSRGGTLTVAAPGLMHNDSDADGDAVSAAVAELPAHGELALSPDGSFTYQHGGSTEPSDTFSYTVTDGLASSQPAAVTITISETNAPPVAVDDLYLVSDGGTLDVTAPGLFTNDSDSDTSRGQWTISVIAPPSHGALTVGTGGAFTYSHDGSGIDDAFTYRVSDGLAFSNPATVTLRVSSTNNAPVALPDGFAAVEDTPLTIGAPGLLVNDTDADGSPVTAALLTLPASGTVTVAGDGSFVYTPGTNFNGSDSFSYRVTDGALQSAPATVTITIAPVNDPPAFLSGGDVAVDEDVAFTGPWASGITAGPADEAGQALAFEIASVSDAALFGIPPAISPAGVLTVTPATNRTGSATVVVRLRDDGGTAGGGIDRSPDTSFVITVRGRNDGPRARADGPYVVAEGATLTVAAPGLLANDSDPDAQPLSASLAEPPAHGQTSVNTTGSFTYTHDGSETRADAFRYSASDGTRADIANVSIEITEVNDPPVAAPDAKTTAEDSPLSFAAAELLTNDSAGDGEVQALTVTGVSTALGGTVSLTAGVITFTPAPDRTGAASFRYTIVDDGTTGGAADPRAAEGLVTITIDPANDAPGFTSTPATEAFEDAPYSYAVAAADVDADVLTISAPAPLPAWLTLTSGANGMALLAGTPTNAEVGSHAIAIAVSDGTASTTQTFSIAVANTNDAPSAAGDTVAITEDDAVLTITGNVLANDGDVDGDALAATPLASSGTFGSVTIAANGDYAYTLANASAGVQALADGQTVTDSFTYSADDGNGGTASAPLTITIAGANDAPSFTSPGAFTAVEDVLNTFPITASDVDAGAMLSIAPATPLPAWIVLAPGAAGTAMLHASPLNIHVGTHTIALTVSDGAASATQTITIDVTNTNDAPVANADANDVQEDADPNSVTGNVLTNDADQDPGDALHVSTAGDLSGTYGDVTIAADGTYSYMLDNARAATQGLALSEQVTDVFDYTAADPTLATSASTLTITVTGVNDAPSFTSTANEVLFEEVPFAYAMTTADVDNGATLTITTSALPGWLAFNATTNTLAGMPTNADVGTHVVTLTVTDEHGATDTQTLNLVVSNVNDAPVANADANDVDEDEVPNTVTGNVLTNDTDQDAGDALSVSTAGGLAGTYGDVTIAANGDYTYTVDNTQPVTQALALNEEVTDVFNYTAADIALATSDATLTITVTGINDAPAFTSTPNEALLEDAPFAYPVTAADVDNGATLTITTSALPGWLTFNGATNTLEGTPGNANVGTHVVTLTVTDEHGATSTQTLTLVVSNINDAPVANADVNNVAEDEVPNTVTGNVLTNDTDQDAGDALSVSTAGALSGTYGDVTIAANGDYTYTLDNSRPVTQALALNEEVTDVFNYTAADVALATSDATLTITVTGVNDAPAFTSTPNEALLEDAPFAYPVTAADVDNGATLTITTSALPGWLAFNATTNTLAGMPTNADVGTHVVTLTVTDEHGATSTQTLNLVVSNVNDAPVANADANDVDEDEVPNTVTGNVLTNDTDHDAGDALSVSTAGALVGTHGDVTIAANGNYTYTLDNSRPVTQALALNEEVADIFNYTAADMALATSNATLTVTVTGVNDAPAFTSTPNEALDEDAPFTYAITATDVDNGATLTITTSALPGWLTFNAATSTLNGTPGNADVGTHVVTLTVTDEHGATDTQTLTLLVSNVNDAPVANADVNDVDEDVVPNTVTGNVLTNDTDQDAGDALNVSTAGAMAGTYGDVTIAANGDYTYTLDNTRPVTQALALNEEVTDVFNYTATDVALATSDATLTITVTGVNDAPAFTSTADESLDEDAPFTYAVAAADVDNGATLTITTSALPGWLTFNAATSTLNGTPRNADVGTHVVTLTVTDEHGATDTQTLTLVVSNVNDAPVANADVNDVDEDEVPNTVTGNVLTNDTDQDVGDTLSVSTAGALSGTYGDVTIAANGNYTYTLDNARPVTQVLALNEEVTDVFNYTAADMALATSDATLTISVTGVNDAPAFTSTADETLDEDAPFTYAVTATDVDNGAALIITTSALPGWLTFNGATNTLEGTPGNADVGTHVVTLTVTDEHGATDTQTLTVVVSNVNDAPVANADVNDVDEDEVPNTVTGNVLTNDTDQDAGDALSVSTAGALVGTHGDVTIAANGDYTYTLDNTRPVTQALALDEEVTDLFNYTASDVALATSGATLTVTVTGINDAPAFTSTADESLDEDAPFTYAVTATDVDNGATLTITTSALPGWLTFNTATNTLNGTPGNADVGTHVVTLTVTDEHGATDTQTLTLVVSNINDAPVANADVNDVDEDEVPNTVTGNVLTNDTDQDAGDALNVSTAGALSGTYGDVTIAANGDYTYTLDNTRPVTQALALNEEVADIFNYTAADIALATSNATLTITVTGVNDAPAFTSTADESLDEDVPFTYAIAATDVDNAAALTITTSALPGWLTFNTATSTLSGMPTNADVGTHVVTLTVADEHGATDTQTLTLVVSNVNDAPVANADVNDVDEDEVPNTVTGNVLTNDTDQDAGDALNVSTAGAMAGTYGDVTIAANGDYTYTLDNTRPVTQALALNEEVTDVFNYTAADPALATSASTLTITVTGVNDAPAFTSTADETLDEDAPFTYAVAATDVDNGNVLTITHTPLPAWLTFTNTGNGTATLSGTPVNANVGTHNLTLTVTDQHGASDTQSLSLVVTNVNDAPIANFDSNGVSEDAVPNTAGGNVLTNDVDIDAGATLTIAQIEGLPANVGVSVAGTYGTVVVNANGSYTYTLDNALPVVQALRISAAATDVFDYAVSDGMAADGSTLTITITGANDAPVAVADSYSLPLSGTLNAASVLGNDTDVDSGDTLTAILVSDDTDQGTLTFQPDGTFTYTKTCSPCADDFDSFTYEVNDGTVDSNTVTVTIVYNTPPNAVADTYSFLEDSGANSVPAVSGLLANDTDVDTNPLSLTSIVYNSTTYSPGDTISTPQGSLVVNANGSLSFATTANEFGAVTFDYVVSDTIATATGNVTITIVPVNDQPSFTPGGNVTVVEDAPAYDQPWASGMSAGPANESTQTLTFFASNSSPSKFAALLDGDPSGDEEGIPFIGVIAAPAIKPNGNLTFDTGNNVNGVVTVTAYLKDSGGTTDGGVDRSALPDPTFTITILPKNDAPNFAFSQSSITQREDQNTPASPLVLANFARTFTPGGGTDEASQSLVAYTIRSADPAAFATLTIDPVTGTLTMVPAQHYNGTTTIFVKAQDNGGTANGGVDFIEKSAAVTYLAMNDAPILTIGPNVWAAGVAVQQVHNNWASAVVGPANEIASQAIAAYTVTVPNATHQALFSALPTIDLTGTLRFTPAAGANGNATVSVTVRDNGQNGPQGCCVHVNTSAAQTFTISIGGANSPPAFTIAGNQSVPEESPAQTVPNFVTAVSPGPNAADAGQTVTFSISNNNNALFNVQPALAANGANYNLTYTPKPNTVGTATVTITATDSGSNVAPNVNSFTRTFTITVRNVNDMPSFSVPAAAPDSYESAGPETVANFATSINKGAPHESSDVLTFVISGNTNPSLFSAGPAISATGTLTYTAAPGLFGSATITVYLKDDGGTWADNSDDLSTATQSFTITVLDFTGNVNDPPTFTKGADATAIEDSGAQSLAGWATGITPGGDDGPQNITFEIVSNSNTGLFTAGAGQPAVSSIGTLTFTPNANAFGSANISIRARDDGGTGGGGVDLSASQSFTITVSPKNDAPAFSATNRSVAQDAGPQTINNWITGISAGPAESQTVTVTLTWTSPVAGLFSTPPALTGTGTARSLTFTSAPGMFGAATLTVTAQDNGGTANGGVDTTVQSYTLTIGNVNDPPSFTKGADQTWNEDAGPRTFTNWATSASAGPADEAGQTLTFAIVSNTNPTLFSAGPAITRSGSFGTLTFTPAPNAFGTATIGVALQDNGGTANGGVDTSPTQTFTITINAVNDRPSFDIPATAPATLDNAGLVSVSSFATNLSAGPANETGQTLTFQVVSNTNAAIFTTAPAIASNGTLTYQAAYPGVADVTVNVKDSGGTANGGLDTSTPNKTFRIEVGAADPPVVPNKTYQTHAACELTIGAGDAPHRLLDGATGATALTITSIPTTFSGATVTVTNASTGTFKYNPAPGHVGTETFTFRVCDSRTPARCTDATATVTVTGGATWYVDDSAPPGGNGTLAHPFQSLASVEIGFGNDAPGTIFIFSGNYTAPAGFGVGYRRIIGQGASGSFDTLMGIVVPPYGTIPPRPSLGGAKPVVDGSMMTGWSPWSPPPVGWNEVIRGVRFTSSTNFALQLNSGVNGVPADPTATITVQEVEVVATGAGLGITHQTRNGAGGHAGTVLITNSSITVPRNATALFASGIGGGSFTVDNTPITTSAATSTNPNWRSLVYLFANSAGSITWNANSPITGTLVGAANGVEINNNNGDADFVFNCPITLSGSGSSPAFTQALIWIQGLNGIGPAGDAKTEFNGQLNLTTSTGYPHAVLGQAIISGRTLAITANNNVINATNTHTPFVMSGVYFDPVKQVKWQTINMNTGFTGFDIDTAAGPFTVSSGTIQNYSSGQCYRAGDFLNPPSVFTINVNCIP